jgi:hypothetical protein
MKHTLLIFSFLGLNASLFAQVPTNGLVASYPFNGNANDESGNNNNGTVNGATLTTDRFGKANSAYLFNNNSQIKISYNSAFAVYTFTVSAWIYIKNLPPSSDPQDLIFGKGWGYPQFYIRDTGKLALALMNSTSTSSVITSNANLSVGKWYHVVGTFENNTFQLFINGALDKTTTAVSSPSFYSYCNSEYWIGGFRHQGSCMPNDNTQNFDGTIDDVNIYNRPLSGSEITALYQDDNTGLVAYYPFDGNAKDMSGNNKHGIVSGAILTTDRSEKVNSAYSFDGQNSTYIQMGGSYLIPASDKTFSTWVKYPLIPTNNYTHIFTIKNGLYFQILGSAYVSNKNVGKLYLSDGGTTNNYLSKSYLNDDKWHNITITINNVAKSASVYIDGQLDGTLSNFTFNSTIGDFTIGGINYTGNGGEAYIGKIDDFRIYNRALKSNEIALLYSENKCFETIAVTDTLKISSLTGFNELPQDFGTVKIYPNPTNDILNVAVSKLSASYSIKITNSTSQTVYSSILNSASSQINMNSLGNKGLYFIQIFDASNNVLETKKLLLE